ncbi:MAG: hypothetical protein LBB40_02525 [Holophagales bacterium]|jgi:hypothetical protein|nr:hypothetical protein [Holophagales bacterium]
MGQILRIAIALAFLASLQTQSPKLGFAFNIIVPAGSFREKIYDPTPCLSARRLEGYNIGAGAQLTMSFPHET